MTDQTEQPSTDTDNKTSPPDSGKSGKKFLVWLLLLIVVGAAAGYFIVNKRIIIGQTAGNEQQQAFDKLSGQVAGIQGSVDGLQGQQATLNKKLEAVEEIQQELEKHITGLYQQQNNDSLTLTLAEAEYLIVIAIHRLTLESDIDTALVALRAADDRLKSANDPGLLIVRKQLASDINALLAVTPVDISGLALYLGDLAERSEELPLKGAVLERNPGQPVAPEVDETQSWWRRLSGSIWQELKDVIVITREDDESVLSLLPQQEYFLRQNLRLQLESARYAALRRDTANVQRSIDLITDWLNRYFDISQNSVANIIDTLSKMRSLELQPYIPDISSSLETVRAYAKEKLTTEEPINNEAEE